MSFNLLLKLNFLTLSMEYFTRKNCSHLLWNL